MNNDPFGLFINLISFDQQLIKIETELKKLKQTISNHNNQIEKIRTNLDQSKLSWGNTKKIVDLYELKMKEFDEQEKAKKQQLDQSTNNKEYSLLKKELEKIKQSQYDTEPQIIEAWNKSEAEKKELESKKETANKQISELEELVSKDKQEIDEKQKELDALVKERTEREKHIPKEWIEKYNLMRLRVDNPVVEVVNNSCTACFHHVTSQNLLDLKSKKLLECKRCYRFLYLK